MSKEYNGHRSWTAWNVSLWLYNDESLYRLMVQAKDRFNSRRDQGIKAKHRVTCESGEMRAIDLRGACVRIMAWYEC